MSKKNTAKCTCCGKVYEKSSGFYQSFSPLYEANDNRMHICKDCVCKTFDRLVEVFGDEEVALYRLTLLLDVYFDNTVLNVIYMNARRTNSNLAKVYFQKINLSKNYKTKTSLDSHELVVKDDFIITARSAAASIDFAFEIIEYLQGKEQRTKIEEQIYY